MELNSPAVGESKLLGNEGGPEGGLRKLVELVIGESGEDAAFADATAPHGDELDFGNAIILLVHLCS